MSFKQQLIKINACQDAIDWVENRTLQQAWNDCHRGDWMLWLLEKMEGKEEWLDEKEVAMLWCFCVRKTLKYLPEGETRPLKAIETKEKWVRGEATKEEVNIAISIASISAWIIAMVDAFSEESPIQADYIRTQFTPPV